MPTLPELHITPISTADQEWVVLLVTERWGAPEAVSRGHVHDLRQLPGFIARLGNEAAGLVTYHIEGLACEIVTLDSLVEGQGVGSALIQAVSNAARQAGCRRLWLITTNDNTHAIRFYQKRGFHLAAVHLNALAQSRLLKPSIPELGMDGIPLRDEFEFEINLVEAS